MSRHILCIGAHPDDIEGSIGGTCALLAERGDALKFVSVTDGSKGHYADMYVADPDRLARRRYSEAQAAAAIVGAEFEMMGLTDGEVYVNPANTEAMVRLLRSFGTVGQGPDLILLNRPNDYHRDHRATAQLVLDAVYLLTVPAMCPDTPALRRMPVLAYWADDFTEGGTFRADIVVGIDRVLDQKVTMLCCHTSQFFEWLPYNQGGAEGLKAFPTDANSRHERLHQKYQERARHYRARFAAVLENTRNAPDALSVECIEAFQISEYGRQPDAAERLQLFP